MKRRKDMDFSSIVEGLKKTADELLEKTDVDEKAVAKYKELKDKAEAYMAETDVDEKLKEKAKSVLDKTDIDEKIAGKVGELKDLLK